MKKKVYELAKEMGVRSKDLIARAGALGIEVKSHMSSLTDEEIGKIRDGGTPETGKAKTGKGGSSQTNSGAAGKETAAALRGKETGAGKEPEKRVSKTGRKVPVGTPIIMRVFWRANQSRLSVNLLWTKVCLRREIKRARKKADPRLR